MPEISLFYGIHITMFYNDHNPPHFHAEYAGHKALGRYPRRLCHSWGAALPPVEADLGLVRVA